jgi:hypothetical protein
MRLLLIALLVALGTASALESTARAAETETARAAGTDWKAEFDRVCGQSDNAMNMTVDELKGALARCDALKSAIEGLEATPRKIYLKRLQMCRNLFGYMLESRLKGEQK